MRSIVFGTIACLWCAQGAAAQSLEQENRAALWTGPYVGVYGAYGWGDTESKGVADAHPRDPFAGLHAGYNIDVGAIVAGIEADVSWSDLDDDMGAGASFVTQDIDNIAGLRARAGVPIDDMLLFATAGWSWAKTEYGIGAIEDRKNVSGPSIGFGLQYLATDNLSVRLEYEHFEYGSTTYQLAAPTKADNSVDVIKFGLDYTFR